MKRSRRCARRVIKPHGQVRCGTNYLSRLLRENFAVTVYESEEGGWKHGPIQGAAGVAYIVLTKDPYSWLVSFRAWEEIHSRSHAQRMIDFLTAPVSHPALRSTWSATHPLDAWNRAYGHWMTQRQTADVLVLPYEGLLTRFEESLGSIERRFGLQRGAANYSNVFDRVDVWTTPRPRHPLDLARYVDGGTLEEFDNESAAFVRQYVDQALVRELGYRVW